MTQWRINEHGCASARARTDAWFSTLIVHGWQDSIALQIRESAHAMVAGWHRVHYVDSDAKLSVACTGRIALHSIRMAARLPMHCRTGTSGTHGSSTAVNEVHTPTAGLLPKHACDLLVLNAWCAASLHECMTQAHSDHQGMALVWNTWAAERAARQIHIKCIRRPQTGMHGSEICLGETLLGKVNR